MKTLPAGTRIYYGGDMANDEGFGTIKRAYRDRWGEFYDIDFEDGREMKALATVMFSEEYKGHGGTRFVTLEAYKAYRAAIIERMSATIQNAGKLV